MLVKGIKSEDIEVGSIIRLIDGPPEFCARGRNEAIAIVESFDAPEPDRGPCGIVIRWLGDLLDEDFREWYIFLKNEEFSPWQEGKQWDSWEITNFTVIEGGLN